MDKEIFKLRIKGKAMAIVDWANVYGWFADLKWKVDAGKLFGYLKSYPDISEINFYFGVDLGNAKSIDFKKEIEDIGFNLISKDVKWVPAALETTAHFKVLVRRLFDVLDNVKSTNSAISNRLYDLVRKTLSLNAFDTDKEKELAAVIYDLVEKSDGDLKKLNADITALQLSLREPVRRRKCDFDVEISRDACSGLENFETLVIFSGDGDYAALAEDLILNKGKRVIVIFARGHVGREYESLKTLLKERGLADALFLCNIKKLRGFIAQ